MFASNILLPEENGLIQILKWVYFIEISAWEELSKWSDPDTEIDESIVEISVWEELSKWTGPNTETDESIVEISAWEELILNKILSSLYEYGQLSYMYFFISELEKLMQQWRNK